MPAAARARASTTPRRRCGAAARRPRPTSSPTATRAAWSAPSATPRCPRRTRLIVVVGRTPASSSAQPGRTTRSPASARRRRALQRLPRHRHRRRGIDLILSVVAGGAAVPGADLHRHGDPARRRPPGAAVRRDAAGRRDAAAGLGHRGRRVDRRRRARRRRRASALFFALRVRLAGIPFTGTPFFAGDLSLSPLDVARGRARRARSAPRSRPGWRCAGSTSPRSASPAGSRRSRPVLAADPARCSASPNWPSSSARRAGTLAPARSRRSCPGCC